MASLRIWIGFIGRGDGKISDKNLVNESRIVELRWVRKRKRGARGFDEIRVYIFRLIAIFESEVLEERVGGERRREEILGEKDGRIREDCGLGSGKKKRRWSLFMRRLTGVFSRRRHVWGRRRRRR